MWSVLLVFIGIAWISPTHSSRPSPNTTQIAPYNSLLGDSCRFDAHCRSLVSNSKCHKSKCVCQAGYVAKGKRRCIAIHTTTTITTTIQFDSALDDPCQSDINCIGLVENAICLNGICVCQEGYVPIGRFSCIPEDITTIPTTTSTLIFDSGLGDFCQSSINCAGLVGNALCVNGICVCREGYVANGRFSCILEERTTTPSTTTMSIYYDSLLGDSCQSNDNCDGLVANAICLDDTCVCRNGYMAIGADQCILVESNIFLFYQ